MTEKDTTDDRIKDVLWSDVVYINTYAMRIDSIANTLADGYYTSLADVVNDTEYYSDGEHVYRITIDRITDDAVGNAKEEV